MENKIEFFGIEQNCANPNWMIVPLYKELSPTVYAFKSKKEASNFKEAINKQANEEYNGQLLSKK